MSDIRCNIFVFIFKLIQKLLSFKKSTIFLLTIKLFLEVLSKHQQASFNFNIKKQNILLHLFISA